MLLVLLVAAGCGLANGHFDKRSDENLTAHRYSRSRYQYCPVFYSKPLEDSCVPPPASFVDFSFDGHAPRDQEIDVLEDAYEALEVLQDEFFEPDYGVWPSAIDWTGAVAETIVSGMLTTLTKSLANFSAASDDQGWKAKENLLSSYFAQVINSYYGQDIVSLRGEAYDDMLWVVLGWIEAMNFVREHASRHYPREDPDDVKVLGKIDRALRNLPWHGESWVPAFAHRARIFWNLASRGWDTQLCEGGMIWDRRLSPYKNAITNELWISASVSMYQFFPGDNITAPWLLQQGYRKKNPAHLAAATEGYDWLMGVGMRNGQGLFTDGFHISHHSGKPRCDLRNNMVYTYNQGTLLTGNRGLWTVTGNAGYLQDGHDLIQSAIRATGWHLQNRQPMDDPKTAARERVPPWRGLGRGGIMEERCDALGTCSQDAQIFKGIFFHHLVAFCAPLDPITVEDGITVDASAFHRVKSAHAEACQVYLSWVRHNALAAAGTRDSRGVFGMWWTAGLLDQAELIPHDDDDDTTQDGPDITDYRNSGTPLDDKWGSGDRWSTGQTRDETLVSDDLPLDQQVLRPSIHLDSRTISAARTAGFRDVNDRGRGRTVETQLSGLALLRAYWELSQRE